MSAKCLIVPIVSILMTSATYGSCTQKLHHESLGLMKISEKMVPVGAGVSLSGGLLWLSSAQMGPYVLLAGAGIGLIGLSTKLSMKEKVELIKLERLLSEAYQGDGPVVREVIHKVRKVSGKTPAQLSDYTIRDMLIEGNLTERYCPSVENDLHFYTTNGIVTNIIDRATTELTNELNYSP